MSPRIRIGNQTAFSARDPLDPFHFALAHGFDAFEWFADKKTKTDGSTHGWDEPDIDPAQRDWLREQGRAHDIRYTVHAPWQANPLYAEGRAFLSRSIAFARDIGSELVNLHLYMDAGPAAYVESLLPILAEATAAGIRLSIENTPHTTPVDFNQTFTCFRDNPAVQPGSVGLCLDIGHANLCQVTHNNFLRFLDLLAPVVPLIHMHVHENFGDADTHLTLFTGPARHDDGAVRTLLQRLRARAYQGVLILEQWPHPPSLLTEAAARLRGLLANTGERGASAPC